MRGRGGEFDPSQSHVTPLHGPVQHPSEFAFVSPTDRVARTFRVAPGALILGTEVFSRFAAYFGIGPDDEFRPVSATVRGTLGHQRFTQHYRGVPVIGC